MNENFSLLFKFWFPSAYPQDPPYYELQASWLTQSDQEILSSQLTSQFKSGEIIIFQWIEWLRENTASVLGLESRSATVQNTTTKPYVNLPKIEIISGDAYTVSKSKFIAHVAKVSSLDEVNAMVSQLKQNKKIENATHNMVAYRFHDGKQMVENRDDDGEGGAGDTLLYLLQRANVTNVCVVVTRWYGGVKLGPDRFRVISDVAKQLLVQVGYLKK